MNIVNLFFSDSFMILKKKFWKYVDNFNFSFLI